MNLFGRFFLDKEKDIIINLYKEIEDELIYIIETPNHKTGNLISNLAKICNIQTVKNSNDMKIITGTIPCSLNGDNKEVYILRLGGIKIANIYTDRNIEIKATIPAIVKTLMSQTKDYKIDIKKTIIKSHIIKKLKLRTDVHTHMNANLSPDCLIALGIENQINYPLYYIKKLGLKLSDKQQHIINKQRKKTERQFVNSELTGKYLTRKIDDNTFINFADFILNNLENVEENISKIRTSLSILKDGQAVFTNLEKLYIYRYVFAKASFSENKISLDIDKIDKIHEEDIKNMIKQMILDSKDERYSNNTMKQDKLLWIAREYMKQGIYYVEIADTDLTKPQKGISVLEEIHAIMPEIEKETGVMIRFLYAFRRIPLTIIKDQKTSSNYLRENLDVMKAVAKSPYVVGSDFIGEEINDIQELHPAIDEIVQYVAKEDEGFTIRIHAGENDSLRENVANSILCIKNSLKPGQKMPRFRLGHGLYTQDLDSSEGKKLIEEMKQTGAIMEFQLTSNVRLNNLSKLEEHPIKKYLSNGVKCIQGTDGCGFYGIDTIDEQLALANLLDLQEEDFIKMRKVEDEIIENSKKYFEIKNEKFKKLLNGRTITEVLSKIEQDAISSGSKNTEVLRINDRIDVEEQLKGKIKLLPEDKIPIVIAGGSFNAKNRDTVLDENGINNIRKLVQKLDANKTYFVVGHKLSGYEKAILDASKSLNKNFEIDAIVPKTVSKTIINGLEDNRVNGIRISPEEEFGIYKSFNYEIFERRNSIVVAFDGNSPVSNLVQEAKNGKGKSKIYVNTEVDTLREKAKYLEGYVTTFAKSDSIIDKILNDYPELEEKQIKQI